MSKRLLTALLFLAACGSKKIIEVNGKTGTVVSHGVATMAVNWLKERPNHFDIEVSVTNDSGKSELILLEDIHCQSNRRDGRIKMQLLRPDDIGIPLKSQETKTLVFTCDLDSLSEAPYRLLFGKIHEDPQHDGHTVGATLAENLNLEFPSPFTH